MGEPIATRLGRVRPTAVSGADVLVIGLSPAYNYIADWCESQDVRARIESALKAVLGRPASLRFERAGGEPGPAPAAPPAQGDDLADDPLVRKVVDLFEARRVHVEE